MSASPIHLKLPNLIEDPDGVLAAARAEAPVVDSDIGPFVVRYETLRSMLQDRRMQANFPAVLRRFGIDSGPFYEFMSGSALNKDGEAHRTWRQQMAKTFTPRNVDELRPFLERESHRLLNTFLDDGECEFIDAYARRLPSLGLCELVGVPKEDRARFCEWADIIGLGFNPVFMAPRKAEVDAALVKLRAYALDLVRARKAQPSDDLVSRLAGLVDDPEASFSEQEAANTVAGLVFAGHETTKNQLGWMLVVLADAPEEWDRVAQDPTRAKDVVEEVLRLRSAAANVGRTTTTEVELGGKTIPEGTRVAASIWSANRDADVFPDPNRVNVEANRGAPQLAFGQGAHHCLGAALARAELQTSLVALSQAMTCPVIQEGAEYWPAVGITGPTRLPIRFQRRSQ